MIHPTIGWSVARLLEHLNDSLPYVAITGPIAAGKTPAWPSGWRRRFPARLILERPDWSRLDAFYADPAGHAWADGVGISRRAQRDCWREKGSDHLLERPIRCRRQMVPDPFFWTVSDFWFDQSAAFARAWLPAERLGAFLERYERLRRDGRAAAADRVVGRAGRRVAGSRSQPRTRRASGDLTAEQLERIRQAVIEQAAGPAWARCCVPAATTRRPSSPKCWPRCAEWSRMIRTSMHPMSNAMPQTHHHCCPNCGRRLPPCGARASGSDWCRRWGRCTKGT